MNSDQDNSLTSITTIFEVVPEDEEDVDVALLNAIEYEAIELLEQEGNIAKPIYTGERGVWFPVEIITPLLNIQSFIAIHQQSLGETSNIITITTPVLMIVSSAIKAFSKHGGVKKQSPSSLASSPVFPIKVTIVWEGTTFSVEDHDANRACETLNRMIDKYAKRHPEFVMNVKQYKTPAKITARIPKRTKRHRR